VYRRSLHFDMNDSIRKYGLTEKLNRILPSVAKPARYWGGELNSVRKQHNEVSVTVALAFPDIYDVGMSNLGLRILYHVLNSRPEFAAERVFAPAPDMEARMREVGIPLYSLESRTPLRDFDIVGFSLAYELTFTTVLNMLDLAGIPLLSSERGDADPIVIAGGHCAANPEPMADFIDAFAIGDGEDVVLDIADAYAATKGSRQAVLERLAKIEGVYVPSVNTNRASVRARVASDLETASYPDRLIVPFTEIVHDRVMLEIMRGCTRGCRFCQAGMITRPVRERSADLLLRQARELISVTGHEEIALTSLSSADYTAIASLVRCIIAEHRRDRVGVSLPSLRADAACVQLAAEIQKVRKSGLTFAPEAGTQRLRDVINKNVTEQDLLTAIEAAVAAGWKRVKLYFMIGLPTETDDDLRGIGELVRRVLDVGLRQGVRLAVNVTISPFVPKSHTPFQWRPMVAIEELERRLGIVRSTLKRRGIALSWHDPRSSRIEAILARGDRSLGRCILSAWRSGAKLEQDHFRPDLWDKVFEEAGIKPDRCVDRPIPKNVALPWDHIDFGVKREFLATEDERADKGITTPDCRLGYCSGCGACSEELRIRLAGEAAPETTVCADMPQEPSDAKRIQFTFQKTEEARWLGHLDLLRVFERAVRMSGINVAYSHGFNPRAKMSIVSALPLGATADRELLVLEIVPPIDLRDCISRLNSALPEGVRLLDAILIPDNTRGPKVIGSELVVGLSPSDIDTALLRQTLHALMGQSHLLWERESGNKRKQIDIRPGIEALEVEDGPSGKPQLRMRLRHLEFTVKPSEIVEILSREIPGLEIATIHRSALITQC